MPRFWLTVVAVGWFALGGCNSSSTTKPDVSKQDTKADHKGSSGNAKGAESAAAKPKLTRGEKTPADNDTLLLFYPDDPDTLNLIVANDTVSTAFQQDVYEPLAEQKFSNPDEWEPALAESWEFDKETLTYKIKLRKGVYWHPMKLPNGKELPRTEFTSADVKFTFDCVLNETIEAASLRSYYVNPNAQNDSEKYKIKVTAIDKYTVKVQWTEPYILADDFTLGTLIMPRHVYGVDENGEPISLDFRNSKEFGQAFNNHWANTKMCGTGPLIFEEWNRKQEARLRRNPEYWGPPFYFDRVVYRYISNVNTARQQVLQNDHDWVAIPQKDQYIQSLSLPEVKEGKVKLVAYDYPQYRYLGLNQQRELFKDRRVRWAISHAIPVDDIVQKIYFNLATRLSGPFLPSSTACDNGIPPVPYDLDKSRQLLDEAGWKDTDGDGVRDKIVSGNKVKAVFDLIIYTDAPAYQAIAEIIAENCRQIGLEVKITPTPWSIMLQKLRKKEFDATILGWALSWRMDPFQIWHGSQADLPESSNSIGYKNPELDKVIEELRVTLDPQKQTELYHKIHRIIYDDQAYTFLFVDQATAGYDARLENLKFYKIRPCVDLREWTASKPRLLPQ